MKRTLMTVCLVFALTMMLSAQPLPGRPGCGPVCGKMEMRDGGKGGEKMMDARIPGAQFLLKNAQKIGLTEEQVNKIEGMDYDHKKMMINTKRDVEMAELDLHSKMKADNLDKNAILQAHDNLQKIRNLMIRSGLEHRLNLLSLLTAEQKKQLPSCGEGACPGMGKERGAEKKGCHGMEKPEN